jgi:hypothetical protein
LETGTVKLSIETGLIAKRHAVAAHHSHPKLGNS